jgi:hypothetical protein
MGISASGFLGDAKKNMFQTTVKYDDFFCVDGKWCSTLKKRNTDD